ncbi:PRC-barrel domain-containing protein [Psychromarinibacter sp. C21-152]|uniref:PRC-barrel domain-containing protein n=1 Tax=Psychromarinibacter sediminicola TaxID=3033385 RepID=A0AAE3NRJ4_9RHOB|nr:PRC-barrel domain-containing protein [Psychromarinibacter sediminicola]MDF0600746.1 PRC-barrel domain-containing protein [Psychromarinibacter sediminicola]
MTRLTISAIALAAAGAAPALAQDTDATAQDAIDAGKINLNTWTYSDIYSGDGWSIEEMFGEPVYGETGDEIGDVEDFVLNADGEIVAMIAEVGGFWDIADTHVGVPLQQVDMSGARITIPVTEQTVNDYDLFEYSGLPGTELGQGVTTGLDDVPLTTDAWRASDLIGDYVRIQDDSGGSWLNYGYVSDLIISDGSISATIVGTAGSYGPGTYAYPYYSPRTYGAIDGTPAGGWAPGNPTYDLPYLEGDVAELPEFDYERMNNS